MQKFNKFIISFLFFIFSCSAVMANVGETFGFSAKGMAMGNAVTASVNDWSSTFYNVGGLAKSLESFEYGKKAKVKKGADHILQYDSSSVRQYNDQVGFTYLYNLPMMKMSIADEVWEADGATGPDDNLTEGFLLLGVVLDLNHVVKMPSFISTARLGIGFGMNCYPKNVIDKNGKSRFKFDLSLAKVNDLDLRTHQYLRYGRNIQHAVINLGLGFGFLNDIFGVGLGTSIFADSTGSALVKADGLPVAAHQEMSMEVLGHVTPLGGFYIDLDRLLAEFNLNIPLVNDLQIAASYRGQMYMEVAPFAIKTDIAVGGNINMPMSANIFTFYTPQVWNFGLSCDFWKIKLNFDLGYELWASRKFSSAREKQWQERLDLVKKDATVPQSAYQLFELPKYQNVIMPKIGIAYHFLPNLDLIAGYYYQPTMLKELDKAGFFNLMDNNKHVISLGASFIVPRVWRFIAPIEINFVTQGQILTKQTVHKLSGSETLKADGSYAPENKNLDYSYSGFVTSFALEVIMRF